MPLPAQPKERINVAEAANILGVSTRTVQRLIYERRLPTAAKVGRLWTINEQALRSWLRDQEEIQTCQVEPRHREQNPQRGCYWRRKTLWARFVVEGREYRFSCETSDAAVARERREAKRAEIIAAASWGDGRKTISEAIEAWTFHVPTHVSAKTVARYLNSIQLIQAHLEGLHIDEVDKGTVATIIAARRARGITNATIRRDLTALSSLLSFAVEQGWREGNPALDAFRSKGMRERRDPIVLPELRDIERAIERAPGGLKHLVRAAFLTGCRQEELVALERRSVDLVRRTITVRGKGNKARVVPLTDEAVALFRDVPASVATRHVFWHSDGKPFRNVATRFSLYGRQLEARAEKERFEFRRFRFHDLRHRFAVDYLREGRGSIYDLQQVLGHTSLQVTEIYLRFLTPDEARVAKNGPAQKSAQVHRFRYP